MYELRRCTEQFRKQLLVATLDGDRLKWRPFPASACEPVALTRRCRTCGRLSRALDDFPWRLPCASRVTCSISRLISRSISHGGSETVSSRQGAQPLGSLGWLVWCTTLGPCWAQNSIEHSPACFLGGKTPRDATCSSARHARGEQPPKGAVAFKLSRVTVLVPITTDFLSSDSSRAPLPRPSSDTLLALSLFSSDARGSIQSARAQII